MGPKDSNSPSTVAGPQGGDLTRETLSAGAIVMVFVVLAGLYLSRPGLGWDESLQVPIAETYRQWFAGLPGTLNWDDLYKTLGRFHSHPPLAEYAIAGATQLFGNSMGRLYAARVASVISMAALVAAVYFFTRAARGRLAALAASVFLILMPRVFAHSILASIDMPAALWWFVAAALFYAAMENPKLAWVAGLAAALAFLTKITAIALPFVLWPWGIFFFGKRAVPAIVWSAMLTPALFFLGWPFLWDTPVANVGKYFGEKFPFIVSAYAAFGVDLKTAGDGAHRMMARVDIPVFYFGKVYSGAVPWHYPLVMTAVTTPIGILLAAAAGALRWLGERQNARLYAFLLWNVVFWLAAFGAGIFKPYDGVRLFLVIFPFVAILAGIGLEWAWQALLSRGVPKWLAGAALALFVAAQAIGFARYEPFGLSYYNLAVGGLKGAAAKGLPVTFWGETIDDTIYSYINTNAPEGASITVFPMGGIYAENVRFFGLVRPDIRDVAFEDQWDYLIVANRGGYLNSRPDIEALVKDAVVTRYVNGVPTAWLVERKR